MQGSDHKPPLDLKGLVPTGLPGLLQPVFASLLVRLLALERVEDFYRAMPPVSSAGEFAKAVLDGIGVHFDVRPDEQARIPSQGPAIIVANHPFGGLDGLYMIWLLTSLRADVRILANFQLNRLPYLKDVFITIDPLGGREAVRGNSTGLRQALRWVRRGGLLFMFPAGEVAHLSLRQGAVCDPAWSPMSARLIRHAGAAVIPLHFSGRNSWRFQLAGLVHPWLRTALLPRELLNKGRTRVVVRIGQPIAFARLKGIESDDALAAQLRLKTYMLATEVVPTNGVPRSAVGEHTRYVPVAPPVDTPRLRAEIDALLSEQLLAESGEFRVYCGTAAQMPCLLQEIGRCRELTFRAVGEGTGNASDIDLFDDYYEHLFLWNAERDEIVGAYRLGHVDRICARFGKRGLYTSTLFEYREPLLRLLSPALELGRSFVVPEYQRTFAALMLLWKGIGEYLARRPRYRVLFGAVSISNDYASLSKEMLIGYLQHHNYETRLSKLVQARRPFRRRPGLRVLARELRGLADIESLSALVSDVEPDGKGVPILLRQYLKLGGRLLGFNVDASFSNSIDCLIMVDLCETDPRVLNKYMGRENAERFLALHNAPGSTRFASRYLLGARGTRSARSS